MSRLELRTIAPSLTAASPRGFTGHEMLDALGVVHMNGRIYDPTIGRMLQADPIVQSAYDIQNYNRYSYVLNNPLSMTDPSGLSWWTKWRRTIFAIAVAWALGPMGFFGPGGIFGSSVFGAGGLFGGSTLNAFMSAVAGGFAAGGIQGGNLNSALQGALSAALFFGVGELSMLGAAGDPARVAAHALVGCATSAAAGGSCRSGALSAGFAEFAGPRVDVRKNLAANVVKAAVLGAAGAALSGGKAENGALTAAFGYLFNCFAHKCSGADYDSKNPNYHAYGPFSNDLCNVNEAGCMGVARFVLGCQSAIGQSGCTNVVGEEKSYLLPGVTNPGQGNPITQYRASPDLIINGTSPGHELHDGYVVRWLSVNDAGTVSVWTAGIGVNSSGGMQMFNQYGGAALFRGIGLQNALTVTRILNEQKPK